MDPNQVNGNFRVFGFVNLCSILRTGNVQLIELSHLHVNIRVW